MTNLDDQVRQFVIQKIPWLPDDIPSNADIVGTANIDGDDVLDLVEEFGKRFNVNLDHFQPHGHAGPEGCNPLWLFMPRWWRWWTNQRLPICLDDLIESARQGWRCIMQKVTFAQREHDIAWPDLPASVHTALAPIRRRAGSRTVGCRRQGMPPVDGAGQTPSSHVLQLVWHQS